LSEGIATPAARVKISSLIRAKTGFAFHRGLLILSGTAIGQAPPKLTSKQKEKLVLSR
jgi:hypothetical protein